jgi:hypothetical protein
MGTMLTRTELEAKETVYKLHPEFWRRFIALCEFGYECGVPLGVGTGWRVQPYPPPPGFAPPGNSNHEGFPADGWSGGAVAIDTVPDISWDWMEVNCAPYGLRTFRDVNSEPWHVQPSDIPAGRNYRTEPWDLPVWNLPGGLEEDDMPLSDEDVDRVARAVWAFHIETTNNPDIEARPARWLLQRAFLIVREFLGPFPGKPAEDPSMLKEIHREVTK